MYTSNWKRWKKIMLAYPYTRRLYRVIQGLLLFLLLSIVIMVLIDYWSETQLKEQKEKLFGSWNQVFVDVNHKDLSYFENHAFIDEFATQTIFERVLIDDKRIIIGSCSDNFIDLGNIKIISGKMPEKKGELAVEEEYLSVLGVEKVGDKIPENINIPSIVGYQVSGIISNYSSLWNMINSDMKFVNCFIYECRQNELQIFVNAPLQVKQDIEKNFLYYKDNIQVTNEPIFYDTCRLFFIIVGLIIIIFLKIKERINQYIYILKNKKFNKYIDFLYQKIQYVYFLLLNVFSAILLSFAMNHTAYIDFFNMQDNSFYETFMKNDAFYINFDKDTNSFIKIVGFNNIGIEMISSYINDQYKQIINIAILILWYILINWLIISASLNKVRVFLYENREYHLNNFYFGVNKKIFKINYFNLFLQNCVIVLYLLIKKRLFCYELINVLMIVLFTNTLCFFISNKILLLYSIKRLESQIDWILIDKIE